VRSFFDAHLKSPRGSPLDILSSTYPEIEVLR
jgi:hypothetical protein